MTSSWRVNFSPPCLQVHAIGFVTVTDVKTAQPWQVDTKNENHPIFLYTIIISAYTIQKSFISYFRVFPNTSCQVYNGTLGTPIISRSLYPCSPWFRSQGVLSVPLWRCHGKAQPNNESSILSDFLTWKEFFRTFRNCDFHQKFYFNSIYDDTVSR